jgi:hypothetical protein
MDPTDPFDNLDRLQLPTSAVQPASPVRSTPLRPRRVEPFLKGPIPWSWLTLAARLPGKALQVGLALWFRSGLTKSSTVSLSLSSLKESLSVHRDAARRGLAALEQAELVRVKRRPGRKPQVTILPACAKSSDPSSNRCSVHWAVGESES